ncbi:hypothetical protein [Novosphingobium sp.]|uniref:hypothetical protein n=1 Tax=Novosphingobium sp. TaxID=1874826 RepID=UPI0025FFA28B|nr:hypothetical protein [Novosphingobium sp.]
MFIGHWAPALVAATDRRAPSLGVLFIGAQLLDWAFFLFLLLGAEHMRMVPGITAMNPMDLYDMPFTHSLLGAVVWSALFAVAVWLPNVNRRAALLGALVVSSHWLLDLAVHRPDLTIIGGPPKLGLGLWNMPAVEMPLEIGIIAAALLFYLAKTRARSPAKSSRSALAIAVLVLLLAAVQAINWFGPQATEVSPGTSWLAFVAYGTVTGAAFWLGSTRDAGSATRQAPGDYPLSD